MNFHQIYHALLEGKKLQIPFDSAKEAEVFRIRMQQFKSIQDRMMLSLGIISPQEKQVFSFSVQTEMFGQSGNVTATLQFRDRDTKKQFEVRIIDDGEGASEVPSDLGST